MSHEIFEDRRKALEESFFARKNRELLDAMKREHQQQEARQAISAVSGITDEGVLDHMIEAQIGAETVAALTLVPLVEVAWADGSISPQEREAILAAADQSGIGKASAAYQTLVHWLDEDTTPQLHPVWREYVQALVADMDAAHKTKLGEQVIGRARKVAQAAGGILGIHSVSDAEQKMLDKLAEPFA